MNMLNILRACVFLNCAVLPAQVSGDALQKAEQIVRQQGGIHGDLPLQVVAKPQLRDILLGLAIQMHTEHPNRLNRLEFFEVVPEHFEVKDDEIVSTTVQLDADSSWLVALGAGEVAFPLNGFADSTAGFNKMMQSLRIKVSDTDTAHVVFDLFLRAARGEEIRSRVISDDMKLQSVALDDFRSRFPASKRRAAFDAWWRKMPTTTRSTLKPPQVYATAGGFEVKYVLYDHGALRQEKLKIYADGTVAEQDAEANVGAVRSTDRH